MSAELYDRVTDCLGDGSVTGAEDAVEALAESNPFLLAPAQVEGETNPFKTPKSSGRPMNGKKNRGNDGFDRASLAKKFPALRNR